MDASEWLEFATFDPARELKITSRKLPHWYQPGTAVYLTMRFLDSLPEAAIARIEEEVKDWLHRKGIQNRNLPPECHFRWDVREKFYLRFDDKIRSMVRGRISREVNIELDKCHGKCWFRQPHIAKIMADIMLFHNGERYNLDCFVIMPNHVHALFQFRGEYCFETLGQSWLRYSARLINKELGRRGSLWQPEPFDHLIRSLDEFEAVRRYIKQNPVAACLSPSEFLYWTR